MGLNVASILNPITDFWKRLNGSRRKLLVLLLATLFLLSAFLVWFLNRTRYDVLFTDLSAADAGAILAQLEEKKIDARTQGSDTILVPSEQVDSIRMSLAAAGFPKNGVSLEILQQGTGFGLTEEDKAIYRRYQLQQDLQRAIETFDSVEKAQVSLIIPEKSSFVIENQKTPATAAVLLTLRIGTRLSPGNVQAIAELVGKSVPNLKPDGITIIDSDMNVLNASGDKDELQTQDQATLEQQVGDRLKKQVLSLLQPVFGIDRVLAEVSVRLDFDSKVVESIRFEPVANSNTGVIAHIEKIREATNQAKPEAGEPGTGTNGAAIPVYPVVEAADATYEKNSEKVSYEISTIKESLVKAKGSIADLRVSVILDSRLEQSGQYEDSVKALVAGAVGVDDDRITFASLPFNGKTALSESWQTANAAGEKALAWERTRFYIILGAAVLMFLIILATIVRLVRPPKTKQDELYELLPSLNPLNRPEMPKLDISLTPEPLPGMSDDKKIAEDYVHKNPELAANIIRGWLAEEQG